MDVHGRFSSEVANAPDESTLHVSHEWGGQGKGKGAGRGGMGEARI